MYHKVCTVCAMIKAFGSDSSVANALNELRNSNIGNNVQGDVLQDLIAEYFTDFAESDGLNDVSNKSSVESDGPDEVCGVIDDADAILSDSETLVTDDFDVPVVLRAVDQRFMDSVHAEKDVLPEEDVDDEASIVKADEVDGIMAKVDELVYESEKERELQKIRDRQCTCAAFKNKNQCLKAVDTELIYELRQNMSALTDFEKDLVVLGKLSATMNRSSLTTCSKRSRQCDRQRQRTTYFIEGHQICRSAFEFVHVISGDKLDSCIKHYKEHGLTPRFKKSGGKRPERRHLTYDDIKCVVSYLTAFTETHGIILPGRIPGFKDFPMKLLPSSLTKASIFRSYKAAMKKIGEKEVKFPTFLRLWQTLLPFIVFCKPHMDLCWTCQQNNYQVYRSHNLPDNIKDAKLRKQLGHLQQVEMERDYYRKMVASSKEVVAELQPLKLGPNKAQLRDVHMHYSFDFAQQVHLPSDPMKPGPMYFLTPRKCGIFGVCCEALPQQVNYLIDEGASASKGSSAVISYLHHFFANYGLGEQHVDLHCDNCSGQNKNRFMLMYLAWRVMHGLHRTITLNVLITGHTKFAPDWCFGLVKQKFRKTRVCSLDEMSDVVNKSTTTGVNIPQQVMSYNGEVHVTHYDWQELERDFKSLPGIKSYQHFRFTAERPGVVFFKEFVNSEEREFCLLKSKGAVLPFRMPTVVPPPGLSSKRQWYLFDQIRNFCSEETRDTTCPRPTVPRTNQVNDDIEEYDVQEWPVEQPAKRRAVETNCARGRGRGRGTDQ